MENYMKRLSKYDFCEKCRKAQHKMNDGSPSPTLEDTLDSVGYQGPMYVMFNRGLGLYAREGDVCEKCKALMISTAGY